jgi:acetylornithine deacetylase/succinyl-diaminopimelate desuccinylase-like protein
VVTVILALTGCESGVQDPEHEKVIVEVTRPDFSYASTESFDPAEVAAYEGAHTETYRYIDDHIDDHVAGLQRWVRQPSISAQGVGIQQMAEMVRDDMLALGFAEAELVQTSGHPGVWGYYDAGAERTLLLYLMYDVQPVDPEDWRTPPFEGNLVDHKLGRVLMARGATNQKGPERALFNAIESIIAATGTLPVNLMVTAEGEEELGSPNYPEIVSQYEERLKTADGVLFPFNSQTPNGKVVMNLGVKGIIYFEMEARGGKHGGPVRNEIHGSYKAIVDAPAWRLVQALSTLTSADGNTILVPGYYDDIRPPTDEEQRLINGMLADWNDEQMMSALGVERWIDGRTARDTLLDYLYLPTMNIDGIWGGYTGPGTKTILPHMATAKVDSRLPMGIDHETALASIRQHLDDQGYGDIDIRLLGGYPAAQTSVDSPLVKATIGVMRKRGYDLTVRPRVAGSAPFYQFTERLNLPMVFAGVGHGSGAHAPNEYMVIDPASGSDVAGLADVEKFYVDVLFALAEEPSTSESAQE